MDSPDVRPQNPRPRTEQGYDAQPEPEQLPCRTADVQAERLWKAFLQEHPAGYQYTQFCYHFQAWRNNEVSMLIDHKAGDKMFVDYAGTKLAVTDRYQDLRVYVRG